MKRQPSPSLSRRQWVAGISALSVYQLATKAGLVPPMLERSLASSPESWPEDQFNAKSVDELAARLGQTELPLLSDKVVILAPDVAEDGFSVALGCESFLPDTEEVALLVPDNPTVLAARFLLGPHARPFVETRVKTSGSGEMIAWVKAGGRYYFASKQIEVISGGCGQ